MSSLFMVLVIITTKTSCYAEQLQNSVKYSSSHRRAVRSQTSVTESEVLILALVRLVMLMDIIQKSTIQPYFITKSVLSMPRFGDKITRQRLEVIHINSFILLTRRRKTYTMFLYPGKFTSKVTISHAYIKYRYLQPLINFKTNPTISVGDQHLFDKITMVSNCVNCSTVLIAQWFQLQSCLNMQ
jgi:hypothetical protein